MPAFVAGATLSSGGEQTHSTYMWTQSMLESYIVGMKE